MPRVRAGHRGIVTHHSRMTDAADFTSVDGIRVTGVARTLLDLVAVLSPVELSRALDRAERLELFDLAAFDGLLDRANGRAGTRALRAALAGWRETHTRSELEDRFQDLLHNAKYRYRR